MKGVVLGYDTETEAIVLRAEDGQRYRFPLSEWRDRRSPRKGDEVDFEHDGTYAYDVYVVSSAQNLDASGAAPVSIVSNWPVARFFVQRPVLTCALLVLAACFAGAYAIGDVRLSILQAPELMSRMSEALDSLVTVSGTDPSPRIGAGVTRLLLVLLLGLYLVPVLAGVTVWREFVGRPSWRLARLAAVSAIVLPIGLPMILSLVVQGWVIPGVPDVTVRLSRAGVTAPDQVFELLRLYASGTVFLIFAGSALWLAAGESVTSRAGARTSVDPAREPITPKPKTRPDYFAPLRNLAARASSMPSRVSMNRPGKAKAGSRGKPHSASGGRAGMSASKSDTALANDLEAALSDPSQANPPAFLQVPDAEAAPAGGQAAGTAASGRSAPVKESPDLPPRSGSVWPLPATEPAAAGPDRQDAPKPSKSDGVG